MGHKYWCKGAPPQEPDIENAIPPAEGSTTISDLAATMSSIAFSGLTNLRLMYNASDSQVRVVKGMVGEMMSALRQSVSAIAAQTSSSSSSNPIPDLSELIGPMTDVFKDLNTEYKEARMRERLLPNLTPTRRVIGRRYETHELQDGRCVRQEIEDVIYDFDVKKQIEAMLKHNPELNDDMLQSADRWAKPFSGTISDVGHGTGIRTSPLYSTAVAAGRFPMLMHYYMDGITLTNPLGQSAGRHKVAVSYVVLLNFSPGCRTSPHCIIPVSMCFEKDWSRWPEVDIVCGPVNEPSDGTSFGAQMRRLHTDGWELNCPSKFLNHPSGWVRMKSDDGSAFILAGGGCVLTSADAPAGGLIMGTKIAFGPSTVSICDLCYCRQIVGTNHRAHCCPNSFLPWTRIAPASNGDPFSGLTWYLRRYSNPRCLLPCVQIDPCTCPGGGSSDAALTHAFDANFKGALQVHQVRTVQSRATDMHINSRLDPQVCPHPCHVTYGVPTPAT